MVYSIFVAYFFCLGKFSFQSIQNASPRLTSSNEFHVHTTVFFVTYPKSKALTQNNLRIQLVYLFVKFFMYLQRNQLGKSFKIVDRSTGNEIHLKVSEMEIWEMVYTFMRSGLGIMTFTQRHKDVFLSAQMFTIGQN